MTERHFTVTGLKCGGCVSKAQDALKSVPGVVEAQVDLASKSATVRGDFDSMKVLTALEQAGYPAAPKD